MASLNECIVADTPMVTLLSALGDTSDPATAAAVVQMAIGQERQLSGTLTGGAVKTAVAKIIADLQVVHTDVASANCSGEDTDTSTISSDTARLWLRVAAPRAARLGRGQRRGTGLWITDLLRYVRGVVDLVQAAKGQDSAAMGAS